MNMNPDYNERTTINMSNQYTKDDYCLKLWSQSQLRTKEEQNSSNINKQLKKRKCRGNRKLQNFRRRCRVKGMNNETIENLLASRTSDKQIQHQNQEKAQEKMMSNTNSFSKDINNNISIFKSNENSGNSAEKKSTNIFTIQLASLLEEIAQKEWISSSSMMKTSQSKRIKYYRLSTDHWKQSSKLLPNYNKLSHHQFVDLFSKGLPIYRDQIRQFLTNIKMFHFIQQHAALMCTYFQLKIEDDYWNYLANLSDIPIFNWLLQVSKDVTLPNSINWDHTKTKTRIKDRQELIKNKLQQVEIDLDLHLQQYSSSLIIENTTYFEHSIKITFMALAVVIRNDLQLFYMNFEQKKILLHFDIKDAYYVRLFYDLNPTKEQIRSTQQIWRTKLKLCKRAIVQKKKDRLIHNQISSESAMNNEKNAHHIDNNYQQNPLPLIDSYPSAIHSIINARLDNIDQRAHQIIKLIDNVSPQ